MLRKLDMDGSDSSKVYTTTMDRIYGQEHQRKELGINTLTWLVYAQRPLRSDELLHALAVDTEASEFHHTNIVDIKQVEAACHGLIYAEEETQIVRLIHRTAQEFLKEHGSKWLVNPHAMISKTCTAYLSFIGPEDQGLQMRPGLVAHLTQFCLYEYASWHWEYHTRRREDESSALDFAIIQRQVQTSSRKLIKFTIPNYLELSLKHRGIQGLHLLAHCGLTPFIPQFLEKYDINAFDEFQMTPIAYAVKSHRWEAVSLLIERGANLDYVYSSSRNLLHLAVEFRQERIAKLVIDAGVSVNSTNLYGRTPLHDAIKANQESMVRLLIDSGASINTTDSGGCTPLHIAVQFAEESIVRLLIDGGASINTTDYDGQTLLQRALKSFRDNVAIILARRGATKSIADVFRGVPSLFVDKLQHEGQASKKFCNSCIRGEMFQNCTCECSRLTDRRTSKALVDMIIEEGFEVNQIDKHGRSPLSYAMGNGCQCLVYKLLDYGAEIDTIDNQGRSSLSYAAGSGNAAIISLCLTKTAEVDSFDCLSRTPLSYAAENGRIEGAKRLLDAKAVVNCVDKSGRSPLSYAAASRNVELARFLIDEGADVDIFDEHRRAPISYAAAVVDNGDMIQMLCEKGSRMNERDLFGSSPLQLAFLSNMTTPFVGWLWATASEEEKVPVRDLLVWDIRKLTNPARLDRGTTNEGNTDFGFLEGDAV